VTNAPPRTYWLDGKLVAPGDAHAPLLAHGLNYGTSVFEGIRAYPTPRGVAIFRLDDHLRRLLDSARHYRLKIPYSLQQLHDVCVQTLRASGMDDAYLRPLAWFGDETIALAPSLRCSTHVMIAVFGFPPLSGDAPGFRATISPIQKFSSLALPATVKAGGHYTNSVLALQDAKDRGYDEAILLNVLGDVAEGTGENLFIVKNGAICTNDASADVLYGITRDSILQIAEREGIASSIGPITVDDLMNADEAFFTGTAAEVIPVLSVDDRVFPSSHPITEKLRAIYANAARGGDQGFNNWLTYI